MPEGSDAFVSKCVQSALKKHDQKLEKGVNGNPETKAKKPLSRLRLK